MMSIAWTVAMAASSFTIKTWGRVIDSYGSHAAAETSMTLQNSTDLVTSQIITFQM